MGSQTKKPYVLSHLVICVRDPALHGYMCYVAWGAQAVAALAAPCSSVAKTRVESIHLLAFPYSTDTDWLLPRFRAEKNSPLWGRFIGTQARGPTDGASPCGFLP
eukprot:1069533-Pleurochrysis_carterae.AAC.1